MTVPPNQSPRPAGESPPLNESPPANAAPHAPDSLPTPEGTTSNPTPAYAHPATDTSAPPSATYLSGIVTAGLAAICGAVFTSWAGVQGTLVGAMIGATIGSSVSEVVRAPLDTLERRLVAAGFSARRLRRDGVVKTVVTSPAAAQQAFGMISRGAVVTVGATAIIGFLLAIGGVTALEVATGEPLASMVSDEPASGTTVGNALPDLSPVVTPAPSSPESTASGWSGGGVTSDRPSDPVRSSEGPSVALSPSPSSTETAPNESQNTNSAASPAALTSPDATLQAVVSPPPDTVTPTATGSSTSTLD